MDFLQLPMSSGYKHVLVIICMFSHWTEAFFCKQASASSVARFHLENIIPTWGTPLKLHGDQGTHFIGQMLWQVCTVWSVLQHLYYDYHPQLAGLVECTNCTIKTHLAKFVETLQIRWPKALMLVVFYLASASFGTHKFSPFEIVQDT